MIEDEAALLTDIRFALRRQVRAAEADVTAR